MSSSLSADVLVIGGGPAGIAAALRAAESGKTVILVDDNFQLGGQIWRSSFGSIPAQPEARSWLERIKASRVDVRLSTRMVSGIEENAVLAENDEGGFEVRYRQIVLATGARELFLPFPGWTLTNVMGAGGLQALVKSGLDVSGKKIVIAGTGPLLLAVAGFLNEHNAFVQGVYEQAERKSIARFACHLALWPGKAWQALRYQISVGAAAYHLGWWPTAALGSTQVQSVVLTDGARQTQIECDYLACGFGIVPNLELPALFGCEIQGQQVVTDEFQETSCPGVFTAGETTGIGGVEMALLEGEIAGLAAAGQREKCRPLIKKRKRHKSFAGAMERAFALRNELKTLVTPETIVCRCEDVPWSAIQDCSSWRAAKLHTRCGMGACQGRVCGAALSFLLDWTVDSARPPIYPTRVDSLAQPTGTLAAAK